MMAAWALWVFCGERRVRWAVRGAVGLILAIGLSAMVANVLVDAEVPERLPPRMSLTQYALGQMSHDEFVARMGKAVFEPIVWMNDNLRPTAKVLYVGEARVALARHAVVWATAYDQHPLTEMTQRAGTVEELLSIMRERGITHVYINFSELQRLSKNYGYLQDANWSQFRTLLQGRAQLIHGSGHSTVYELK